MTEHQTKDLSTVACARLASGLTIEDAATVTGLSPNEYSELERRPLQFTLGEMRSLCSELNHDGREILLKWAETFFGL